MAKLKKSPKVTDSQKHNLELIHQLNKVDHISAGLWDDDRSVRIRCDAQMHGVLKDWWLCADATLDNTGCFRFTITNDVVEHGVLCQEVYCDSLFDYSEFGYSWMVVWVRDTVLPIAIKQMRSTLSRNQVYTAVCYHLRTDAWDWGMVEDQYNWSEEQHDHWSSLAEDTRKLIGGAV